MVCLVATRESCRRKRAGCGLSEPAEDLGDERDDFLAPARKGVRVVARPRRHKALASVFGELKVRIALTFRRRRAVLAIVWRAR